MANSLECECRSTALGHSASLKSMLRTITMQGLTLAAITAVEEKNLNARIDVKL